MWRIATILLGVPAVFGAFGRGVECTAMLDTPLNLQVVNLDPHTVWLAWDWLGRDLVCPISSSRMEPSNLGMHNTTFYLTITGGNSPPIKRVLDPRPHYEIDNLMANMKYSVEVFAAQDSELERHTTSIQKSRKLIGDFTTLAKDWPAPTILRTSNTSRTDYQVAWGMFRTDFLKHFIVENCNPECFRYVHNSAARVHTFSFAYPHNYTLSITAVFTQPLIGQIKRRSALVSGTGPIPKPVKIHVTGIDQTGDYIKLSWTAAETIDGIFTQYELTVFDPEEPSNRIKVLTNETSIIVEAPPVLGHFYQASLRPIFKEPKSGDVFGSELNEFKIMAYEPPKPKDVQVFERTENHIRFSIIPGDTKFAYTYDIKSNVKLDERFNGTQRAVFGLSPYQKIDIYVRACFRHKFFFKKTCGEAFHLKTSTNVGKPSKPRNVRVRFTWDEMMELTWEEPVTSNGPIDGYEVYVKSKKLKGKVFKTHPHRTARSCLLAKYSGPTDHRYEIGIRAFNRDLGNDTLKVASRWENIKVLDSSPAMEALLTLLFVNIACAVCFFACARYGESVLVYLASKLSD